MQTRINELTSQLAQSRDYNQLCAVVVSSGIITGKVTAALIATIHDDARIRELGRYGIMGDGPSSDAVPVWSDGLIAKALKLKKPTLIGNLYQLAVDGKLTPESDIDSIVIDNHFQASLVIPLLDNGLLYGVLGVLYNEEPEQAEFNIDEELFQNLMQMAIRSVALSTPITSIRTEENLDLTIRESQVLALLALDKTNKEIAAELSVSVATIKATVASLLKKLKVDSRKLAATRARSSKLF